MARIQGTCAPGFCPSRARLLRLDPIGSALEALVLDHSYSTSDSDSDESLFWVTS